MQSTPYGTAKKAAEFVESHGAEEAAFKCDMDYSGGSLSFLPGSSCGSFL
jgi:hypothetical protein